MVTVKFAVLLFFITSCVCYSKYCKICSNHVMCKYAVSGPSQSCKEYDRNTFLTNDDIYDLVNQINERRNFIATGHSKHLPGAANMKKLAWSEELATFAQRWADQCDPTLRPDKEDQCRDLEYTQVGQNIASIINPSPEFNVKSFIEMWFMQSLDYSGSVSYYDQTKDYRSNYFTQLIWAETKNVGCGRAKFRVNNVIIERIVCNFSPKGNVNRSPVFAIGFPATQCQKGMVPDEKFKGLCTLKLLRETKLTPGKLPESNLLRILNLSNDSVKQEIDPIYNMKQIFRQRDEMESPRQPMMRHIFRNFEQSKTRDNIRQIKHHFWENPVNFSRSHMEHNRKNGRSKLDHTHIFRHDISKNQLKLSHHTNNYNNQCTRKMTVETDNCDHSFNTPSEKEFKCTRGQKTNTQVLQDRETPLLYKMQHTVPPSEMCSCKSQSTMYPTTNNIIQNPYKFNCGCENDDRQIILCPELLRTLRKEGNQNDALKSDILSYSYEYPSDDENESVINNRRNKIPNKIKKSLIKNNRERKKRDLTTAKPFWQMDSFTNDEKPELKSLRYTTIRHNIRPKTKTLPSKSTFTESITIDLKNSNIHPVTEKYLSFDELLHLRKLNLTDNNARRKYKPEILRRTDEEKPTQSTEATTESTEYTTNTPFIRMKHCTRKLTCTWTAATLSNGAHSRQQGSRTPPGYVEGCTRTSTCSRDFMDRNKFPITTQVSTTTDDNDDDGSDYCERRSLNVQKRKSHKKKRSLPDVIQFRRTNDNKPMNNLRKKRRSFTMNQSSNLSYGDLYYLVLRKIRENMNNYRKHNCSCNAAASTSNHRYIFYMFMFLFILIF